MKKRLFVVLIAAALGTLEASARLPLPAEFLGVVTGRVLDTDGRPASVSLYLTEVGAQGKGHSRVGDSDSEGRFALKALPSAHYLLHVILISSDERKEPYFYPGVADQEKATVINLTLGQQVDVSDFRLPPQIQMQKMEGRVVWTDGRAVTDAEVMFATLDAPISYRWPSEAIKKVGQGGFIIFGFKGTTYWLGASKGEASTAALKIALDSDISGIELTLPKKE